MARTGAEVEEESLHAVNAHSKLTAGAVGWATDAGTRCGVFEGADGAERASGVAGEIWRADSLLRNEAALAFQTGPVLANEAGSQTLFHASYGPISLHVRVKIV